MGSAFTTPRKSTKQQQHETLATRRRSRQNSAHYETQSDPTARALLTRDKLNTAIEPKVASLPSRTRDMPTAPAVMAAAAAIPTERQPSRRTSEANVNNSFSRNPPRPDLYLTQRMVQDEFVAKKDNKAKDNVVKEWVAQISMPVPDAHNPLQLHLVSMQAVQELQKEKFRRRALKNKRS